MQPIAAAHLAVEQLQNPLAHLARVGVGHGHDVLGGVAIAQARAPAHLDEGGEAGPDHTGLGLVEGPGVDHRIQSRVGRGDLEDRLFALPIGAQVGEGPVHGGEL